MSSPLIAAKLYIPPPRPNAVRRTRLIDRLHQGLDGRVTLISAPAGFGKTTLISAWVAQCEQRTPPTRVAWVSLDDGDRDLIRFLTYVVAALERVAPPVGAELHPLLQNPQPPPAEALVAALLNAISAIPDRVVLVLDDYHLLDSKPIDDALTSLVDHLPGSLHLVITTREDPALPLARLRARGQLNELRARDLRFTAAEAEVFLNDGMGLSLAAGDIAALEARTEGWIAGLQLAGLSLQGEAESGPFVQAFAGDHRYIVDYLVGEVLERQPEPVRRFLLQTAILDRFNAPLCDAVTGQHDGRARLEALERGNFFLVPLDDRRQWYRYHHLFADVLATYLRADDPDQVATLHRRASVWYEQNQWPADAIRHALAARDFERAATLIERVFPAMSRSRQEATLLSWLQALPDDLYRTRPVLSVHCAGTLLQNGRLDGVDARLRDAERWLDATADRGVAGMVAQDAEDIRRLPGSVALYRAAVALLTGNVAETMTHAGRVLELARDDDQLLRASAAGLLGLAHWTSGDLEAGPRWYLDCMMRLESIGHISDAIGCALALADMRISQGRLRDAMRIYEQGWQWATRDASVARGAADMLVGMSQLDYERNDLAGARQHLARSEEAGEFSGLPQNRYRRRVALARLREADGDYTGALALLDEAERVYAGDFSPNIRPIAALKARIWVRQGRLDEARAWARAQGISVEGDLSYLHEFEHITLARALLAEAARGDAGRTALEVIPFLECLLAAAEAGDRTGSAVEILALLALAYQGQGDSAAALAYLERALALAEPEGYVRLFVDEGPTMATLLERSASKALAPAYTRGLLAAAGRPDDIAPYSPGQADALSERERDVLRLLGSDLSGPEMARELMVSLNTLRTHTKNIYSKLGVSSRLAAIRRAQELHLL